jgi:SHS2 domain-containing protein
MHLEARDKDLASLFHTLAVQLYGQLIDPADVGQTLREKIGVEGETLEELLREWVNALLELTRVNHMVIHELKVTEFSTGEKRPYSVQAEVIGEPLDTHRHTFHRDPALLSCRSSLLLKDPAGYRAEVEL